MRVMVRLIAILMLIMGGLWVGQGLGYIHWPTSSFMIGQRFWTWAGLMLIAVGVALLILPGWRRSRLGDERPDGRPNGRR